MNSTLRICTAIMAMLFVILVGAAAWAAHKNTYDTETPTYMNTIPGTPAQQIRDERGLPMNPTADWSK